MKKSVQFAAALSVEGCTKSKTKRKYTKMKQALVNFDKNRGMVLFSEITEGCYSLNFTRTEGEIIDCKTNMRKAHIYPARKKLKNPISYQTSIKS